MKNKNIGIVIPCYNEEKRLPKDEILAFYKDNKEVSFCFVDDGSTDNTQQLLEEISHNRDRIFVQKLKQNQGKAEAVRKGMLFFEQKSEIDIIGYFDADLATPLEEISLLNKSFDEEEIIASIASRVKRLGTHYYRNVRRHYFGRVFATFASIILKLPVYDTQCGAKLFRKEQVRDLFSEQFISKWIFDVEIFARLIKKFGREQMNSIVKEIPLNTWIEKGDSKIKLKHMLKVPFELLHIKRYYRIKN